MKRTLLFVATICATILAHALTVETSVLMHSYCGRANGLIYSYASGGTPPYTYSWSNGSTDWQAPGLTPGIYTITVTDAVLDQATAQAEILLLSSYGESWLQGAPLGYCSGDPAQMAIFTGQNNLIDPYDPSGLYGPWPYAYSHPNLIEYGQSTMCLGSMTSIYNMLFFDAAPGTYLQVAFQDADGCPGILDVIIEEPFTPPQLQIVGVGPSCQNGASGSMTVSVSDSDGKEFAIYVRRANQTIACYASDVTGFTFDGLTQQDGLKTFNGLQPGDHYLIWTTDPYGLYEGNAFMDYECRDSVLFNVGTIAADCGNLSGRLYLDDDADCVMDAAENRVPGSIVTVEPGPYYLTTNSTGQYSSALPYGSYTVNEQHPVFVQSCPAPVTLSTPATQTVNTGCAGGQPLDVMVTAGSGPARPGFTLGYGVQVRNLTATGTGTVTLTLEFDPALTYISANPAPTSVVGNIITWTDPDFTMTTVFQESYLHVDLQIPPDIALVGTTLSATANITTQSTDGDVANNTYITSVVVTASLDPNDKTAATSSRLSDSQYFLQQDEWIDYTIRFQNTGNDTAFNIFVTDTLPAQLDPASVIMGAGSHPYTWNMGLTGVLSVIFNDIMLPDSNVNEAASHGFVLFRIKPQDALLPGELIANTANIFFDFNDPVITEPSVLVAEFSTGVQAQEHREEQLALLPNPASDRITITSLSSSIIGVRLISADGRSMHAEGSRTSSCTMEVAGLAPGLYFAVVRLMDGSTSQRRFIKY
ncbi:MAG: T9SS type A sorting domain-containing protein [Flavobacteriales bacterium]